VASGRRGHKYVMHPLAPKMNDLTMEEIVEKLSQLHKRANIAASTNHHLANQIYLLIDDYQQAYNKLVEEQNKPDDEDTDIFSDKINIQ